MFRGWCIDSNDSLQGVSQAIAPTMAPPTPKQLHQIAQDRFGYNRLHPAQVEALQSLLSGHDTLAVMPTGSGKSAIYQLAALLIPGPTVIISPLIALQRDQARAIREHDIGKAVVINSALRKAAREEAFDSLEDPQLEFIFLAPEQFNNPETLAALQAARPSLFVVDEAHCISEWGHDFRPDYQRLAGVIEALGQPRVLALTATAAPLVQQEICDRLNLVRGRTLVSGFDRPNLELNVRRFEAEETKQLHLLEAAVAAPKPGIVYAATRQHTEEIAEAIDAKGLKAFHYHAGLSTTERRSVEASFQAGEIEVLVATTAFGMGIDKSDVRFVFHSDIPGSLDSYYQEMGRAGRDGEPAEICLFYCPDDLHRQRFFNATGKLHRDQVEAVATVLQATPEPLPPEALSQLNVSDNKLQQTINKLINADLAEITAEGDVAMDLTGPLPKAVGRAVEQVMDAQTSQKQRLNSRLEMMRGYAEVNGCRRKYLLNYFGEAFEGPCGNCDRCAAGIRSKSGARPFALHSDVLHRSWGPGQVMRYSGDKMTVLFEKSGYKVLSVRLVEQDGLLHPLSRKSA